MASSSIHSATASSISTSRTGSATPQILSHAALPSLIQSLDASDVLEVYHLTRHAPLHYDFFTQTSFNSSIPSNSDSTRNSITIPKSAIGLRFLGSSSKAALELTLEYGPTRMGAMQQEEAVPTVVEQLQQPQQGGQGQGSADTDSTIHTTCSYVNWQNEGRVYYTIGGFDHASSRNTASSTTTKQSLAAAWESANYMASITGTVLEHLLQNAVEYRPAKRYQPFTVVLDSSRDDDDDDTGENKGDGNNNNNDDGSTSSSSGGSSSSPPQSLPPLKVMLKSSSSDDFLHYLWTSLANLGVQLRPILEPIHYVSQVHVTDIQKVASGDIVTVVPPRTHSNNEGGDDPETHNNADDGNADANEETQQQQQETANHDDITVVSQAACRFYSKLQHCVTAIATGDYSNYQQLEDPSRLQPSVAPTTKEDNGVVSHGTEDHNDANGHGDGDDETSNDSADGDDETGGDTQVPPRRRVESWQSFEKQPFNLRAGLQQLRHHHHHQQRRTTKHDGHDEELQPSATDAAAVVAQAEYDDLEAADEFTHDDLTTTSTSAISFNATTAPHQEQVASAPPSSTPTNENIDEAQEANKAAQEAKEKAHEAKEAATTEADNKAADAAEAAANAAQKAADVTTQKQQQLAQKNLQSGDGELISKSLATCFSDPQYGLVQDDGSVTAYLYLDGATYYRLNLTMPYLTVAQVDRPIPQPPALAGSGGGDFIDWTLAICTIGFLVLGVVLLFQRIGFKYMDPLYKMQKWFFSPTDTGYDSDEEQEAIKVGQGFEHAFGEDVIPFSMGGRRPTSNQGGVANGKRFRQARRRRRQQVVPVGDKDVNDLYMESVPNNGQSSLHHDDDDDDVLDIDDNDHDAGHVEMVGNVRAMMPRSLSAGSGGLGSPQRSVTMIIGGSSNRGRHLSGPIILDLPERLSRDPDLVDLPNLSSKSKVAVPVSIEHQRSRSIEGSDDGDTDDQEHAQGRSSSSGTSE